MTEPARICILGGGFGGLYAAKRLNELPWNPPERPEILLVDSNDRFVFSPLLYELLTGELQSWEIAPPFSELLANTRIRFRQATVENIDLDNQQVYFHDGGEFSYDRLVLALGGETPMQMVPGCAEHAIPFRTVSDAYRLEERLRRLETSNRDKIRVAIAGAGYCGVELACKLSDRLQERGRVRLIEMGTEILRNSPEFNRKAAQAALNDRGIWVDLETTVEQIGPDSISLLYKGQVDTIPVDVVLWTVGTRVSPVVEPLPLQKNARGQIQVTPMLQALDRPEIFALGDLAECMDAKGKRVPTTAQAAIQQADCTAWNLWASIRDRPLLSFEYQPLGEMMTLGVDNATLTGLGIKLDGQAAYLVRRLAYLYRMPTFDHQLKVGLNWTLLPLREFLVQAYGSPR